MMINIMVIFFQAEIDEKRLRDELNRKITHVELLEKSLKERELNLVEATRIANEKVDALSKALAILEERIQREEAEKAARDILITPTKKSRDVANALEAKVDDQDTLIVEGKQWSKNWDPESSQYYWYCEEDDFSQWENPAGALDDEYETAAALTDVSADPYESADDMSLYSDYIDEDWQEFWDEAAQSKYWYNNSTVSHNMLVRYSVVSSI